METKTETAQKNLCLRDWKKVSKCPNCGAKVENKGLNIVFESIWEHYVWIKDCPKCGMRIWSEDMGSRRIPEPWETDQCKDYDDPSVNKSRIDYGMLYRK